MVPRVVLCLLLGLVVIASSGMFANAVDNVTRTVLLSGWLAGLQVGAVLMAVACDIAYNMKER